jgi:AcrR family transcriptional regulator
MPKTLQSRKRQVVRDAIYDAAIELFAKRGFDETTVEEVAEAAGISRRSFFRYFESKDDLLALNTVNIGDALCETVKSCPVRMSPFEMVRETIRTGVKFTESQKHTHQVIEIAQRSPSASQAHLSRLMDIHHNLAAAFAAQLKTPARDFLTPYLLAGISQLVMNGATGSWYLNKSKDLSAEANKAILALTHLFCNEYTASAEQVGAAAKKAPAATVAKKPVKKK